MTTTNVCSTAPSGSSQQNGIDVYQALQILGDRASAGHHHHGSKNPESCDACCQHTVLSSGVDESGRGQTIDLWSDPTATQKDDAAVTLAAAKAVQEKIQQDRSRRNEELESTLCAFTVKDLLKAILNYQEQRVQAYDVYNRGLEDLLQDGDVLVGYPVICAEATATFSVLSDSVKSVQKILLANHKRKQEYDMISRLQLYEQKKLNFTAALHLEKIRERNHHAKSSGNGQIDDPIRSLVKESKLSLRKQIISTVEAINDVLEEIRYAWLDEEA